MAIAGVHITSIDVKRNAESSKGKISINNNIAIKDVKEKDFSFGNAQQKGLTMVFGFTCKYSPNVGHIDLEGNVLFIDSAEKVEDIKNSWDSKKRLPNAIMEIVLNAALNKCNIEALKLSQDVSLPSPIPMPKVKQSTVKAAQPKRSAA